ncbi:MAG: precorrin-8X methylmutase [Mogibacterium sp.]|nr:precorrin-8X methylmutase [Mogibacterium sp.]
MIQNIKPEEIEARSFELIEQELEARGIRLEPDRAPVIRRAIHTSADFEYAETLVFSDEAVRIARELLRNGADIVTDTNMALAGIHKKKLAQYGGEARCYMADEEVAREAKERGVTRASVSMERAAEDILASGRKTIFAIGNAPTALVTLHTMMNYGIFRPDFIIGVPVGFVNVTEAKELILSSDVPHIVNRGRKGGSTIAAAIVNALLAGEE